MKIRESDIIDIELPEGNVKDQPLTCPFCGHTHTFEYPVKWDKSTESFVCFKCGKEWTIVNGKPKELHWTVGKGL